MNQVFYQNSLLKFIRSKKGKALDLASGNETFVKLLLKNNWYVDSVDLKKNELSDHICVIEFPIKTIFLFFVLASKKL